MLYGEISGVDKLVSRLIQSAAVLKPGRQEAGWALLDAVFASGGNCFETAHIYGGGHSEHALGQWIKVRGVREDIVIVDKGAHPNGTQQRVEPDAIRRDLLESLERLDTPYIDLYLLHRDNPRVPVAPLVDSLEEHRQAGRIRAYGVSNWRCERIDEANAYAHGIGASGMVSSSPHFSLAEQSAPPWPGCHSIAGADGTVDRDWYLGQRIPVLCWSSLAGGFFSGRVDPGNFATHERQMPSIWCYDTPVNWRRLERARAQADERNRTVPQIALAWLLAQSALFFPIIGSCSVEEYLDNLGALDVRLSPEEILWLAADVP